MSPEWSTPCHLTIPEVFYILLWLKGRVLLMWAYWSGPENATISGEKPVWDVDFERKRSWTVLHQWVKPTYVYLYSIYTVYTFCLLNDGGYTDSPLVKRDYSDCMRNMSFSNYKGLGVRRVIHHWNCTPSWCPRWMGEPRITSPVTDNLFPEACFRYSRQWNVLH